MYGWGQSERPSVLVVIAGVIALACMIVGKQRNLDWLIPIGTVLLGAVLVSPAGRFMRDDDFRSRIFGADIAQQLDGRMFQIFFGVAVALVGIVWWMLVLLLAALSTE